MADTGTPRALTPFARRLLRVAETRELGAYTLLCAADPDGPDPAAGQFAMLAAAEHWGAGEDERPYLPRACSYARLQDGQVQFLLEDVGPGTHRLCELRAGESLWLLGPLGKGFLPPQDGRRAILLGGGVGIAPLAIHKDTLVGAGVSPLALLGFRDSDHAAGATLLADAILATDDGSVGHHGLVTDLLSEQLRADLHAIVYACGPPAMLEAVRAICQETGVPAQLALEAGMACGFGACFGCVVPKRDGGYLRVCLDGPVIEAGRLERIDAYTGSPA